MENRTARMTILIDPIKKQIFEDICAQQDWQSITNIKERDVKSALKWTKSALKRVEKIDMPAYMRKHWLNEIEHRMERLNRKAGI